MGFEPRVSISRFLFLSLCVALFLLPVLLVGASSLGSLLPFQLPGDLLTFLITICVHQVKFKAIQANSSHPICFCDVPAPRTCPMDEIGGDPTSLHSCHGFCQLSQLQAEGWFPFGPLFLFLGWRPVPRQDASVRT